MKKKKEKIFPPKADSPLAKMPRIPKEIWESYRKRGGPHGTPKGKRGYKRQEEKQKAQKMLREGD